MSGLIKSAAALEVRALPDLVQPAPAPVRDPRLVALERENEALRAELATEQAAGEKAVAAARAEGERLGRAAADDAADKRVAALSEGVEAALEAWRARLDSLEALAPALARAALAKLFDDPAGHSNFVAGLIARQMRRLRRESLVAIRVSSADFSDPEALAGLAAAAGTGSVRIAPDADLEPGECRIDLQLGHVDIGAGTQWTQLAGLLDSLAGEGGQ